MPVSIRLVVSGMIKFLLTTILTTTACLANAQSVIVNPDGTHSIAIGGQGGAPTIIVNPNGTHTVVHKSAGHSIAVGPDGKHTVVVGDDKPGPKVIVHPDGRHTVIHATETHTTITGPAGINTSLSQHQLSLIWIIALTLCLGN